MPVGRNSRGKMVTALRELGFDKVFDTDFGIMSLISAEMKDIDIFNSDIYLDLMDIAASYNQVSIFKDIEKHLK